MLFNDPSEFDSFSAREKESEYGRFCRSISQDAIATRQVLNEFAADCTEKEGRTFQDEMKKLGEVRSVAWEMFLFWAYRREGWKVSYSPRIGGKTPDILVSGSGIDFYIEAVTINSPDETKRRRAATEKIRSQLFDAIGDEIQSNLTIELVGGRSCPIPDDEFNHEVFEDFVRQILGGGPTSQEDVFSLDGWKIRVAKHPWRAARPTIAYVPFDRAYTIAPQDLYSRLEAKAEKYRGLRVPFVLALLGPGGYGPNDMGKALTDTFSDGRGNPFGPFWRGRSSCANSNFRQAVFSEAHLATAPENWAVHVFDSINPVPNLTCPQQFRSYVWD